MAMAIRSDKLKVTLFRAFAMRAKLTMLFALCVLLMSGVASASAAEPNLANEARGAAPVAETAPLASTATAVASQPAALQAVSEASSAAVGEALGEAVGEAGSEAVSEASSAASPQPAPDNAALTATGLGTAFEAFQPSEAISADNAVPFPTNI